ncbi:DNA alkylation repair protein [uncultured Phascolarctobacterium sp.]|uniref:DNA alkylation repair protein n=1 Tax=uncultured Phascolarctobacterium sp. TaxID=512296 RepID=UPI00260314CD|nr:DNA alkylation repair protein [uncultured Phascolarctobacterium sp.]
MEAITQKLFELSDTKYRDFNAKLLPTVNKATIIGVRTPALRKLAKEITGSTEANNFMQELPHTYYDENQLHTFLISACKDYDICMEQIENFLPYIDNWATCDQLSPKILQKNPQDLLLRIQKWLASEHTYTIRFGIKMLMSFYLDTGFCHQYLAWVASVRSEEYYVKMMIAWYFATALAKQYDAAVPYLEQKKLEQWTHRKTIQKACESYRITTEQKTYLRTLR